MELLDLRQGGLAQTLDGNFPDLRTSVWQSESTVQAAVQVIAARAPLLPHPLTYDLQRFSLIPHVKMGYKE